MYNLTSCIFFLIYFVYFDNRYKVKEEEKGLFKD